MYPSRKSSRYSSIVSEQPFVENIEELDNETLLRMIEQTKKSNDILLLENELLENYLNHADPELMEEFQKQMIAVAGRVSSQLLHPKATQNTSYRRASFRSSTIASSVTLLEQGPRLNISTKEEIVTEEIDKLCHALEKLRKHFQKEQATLRAKIEDGVLSQQETSDAYLLLEKKIGNVSSGEAKSTSTGESFIEYMEEWLSSADLTLKKLQRRTAVLHSMNIRLQRHLKLQAEGESLKPVDFEQMLIENKQLLSCFEEKNKKLKELKRISGRAGVTLVKHKQKLKEKIDSYAQLKESLICKKEQINVLEKETADIQEAIEKEAKHLDKIQNLVNNYTCPSVMDYVKKQAEIYELTHNLKVWEHRKHLQWVKLRRTRNILKMLVSKHPPSPVEDEKSGRDYSEESM